MKNPRISIVIPIHDMDDGEFFLWRCVNSIARQSFKDFEIVITKEGKMAENTNAGIKRARGDIVKILFMDDYFSHENALSEIALAFENPAVRWFITGTDNNPNPEWTYDIETGNNRLGSPSALSFRNYEPLLFDECMSWMLDCDLYRRLYDRYGLPYIYPSVSVSIGIGPHQMTQKLTDFEKLQEQKLILEKHGK